MEKGLKDKTIFTMNDFVEYSGMSKGHLYHLVRDRKIKCYKPGGKMLFFKKSDIDAFLLSGEQMTADEIEIKANTYVTLNPMGRDY